MKSMSDITLFYKIPKVGFFSVFLIGKDHWSVKSEKVVLLYIHR